MPTDNNNNNVIDDASPPQQQQHQQLQPLQRVEPPAPQQEPVSSTKHRNDDTTDASAETLYPCESCHQRLGRHRFQKKIFRKFLEERRNNHETSTPTPTPKPTPTPTPTTTTTTTPTTTTTTPPVSSTTTARRPRFRLVCHQCTREETARRCKQTPPKAVRTDAAVAESGTKRRPNNFGYCDYVDKLFRMECFATTIAPLRVFKSAKDVSESMAALQAIQNHGSLAEDERNNNNNNNNNVDDSNNDELGGKVLCLCIGDGCTPQTAVLISFLTKGWICVSIDPALSEDWNGSNPLGVRGLCGYKGKLDEFLADPDRPPTTTQNPKWRHLVLVCVHSHARFVEHASVDSIRRLYSYSHSYSYSYSSTVSSSSSPASSTPRTTIVLPPTTIVSLPCCPTFRHVRDIGRPPDVKYDDDCVFSACRSVEVWNFLEEECDESEHQSEPGLKYCSVIPAPTTPVAAAKEGA